MPALKNIVKAQNFINTKASGIPNGEYTIEVAKNLLETAINNFNIKPEEVEDLKAFKYDRPIDETAKAIESHESTEPSKDEVIEQLQDQVNNLTGALAKIATLTGYGNHLKEFHIEKWNPSKKDMSKHS